MLVKKVLLYKVAFKVRLAGNTKKKKKKGQKEPAPRFCNDFQKYSE